MVEVIKRKNKFGASEPVIEIKGEPAKDVEAKPPVKPEVEAKVEVKPPAEPKPPKQPKPQQPQQIKQQTVKKSFFQNFVTGERDEQQGERLVFRMRSGEIVEGVITDEKSGFVKLADVVITDKELGTISKVRWIRMERTQIAHFSPLPTEIKKIEPKVD
ncbi:MAG: hypothetical protein HQK72_14925 [Desulfamplus sp.]|nr:hypothetical protein [Desulfamplus sp.]